MNKHVILKEPEIMQSNANKLRRRLKKLLFVFCCVFPLLSHLVVSMRAMLQTWFESQQENNVTGTVRRDLDLLFIITRVTEWVRAERVTGCHEVQPPCFKQSPVEHITQGCVQSLLKTSNVC